MRAVVFSITVLMMWACWPTASCYSDDWPQWRGIHRDGKSPETGLLREWPAEGPPLQWKVEGIGTGHAAVTVSKGFVYVSGMFGPQNEGRLSAFDLSGKRLWQTAYGPEWGESYPGARSSATVSDGLLYIVSSLGKLACFDAKTGAIVWSEDIGKKFNAVMPRCGYAESVVVFENNVICTPGGKEASLAAFDKKTGKLVWATKSLSDISGYCSPILIERDKKTLLLTVTERTLAGIDPATGVVAWSQSFDPTAEDPNHSVAPVYADGRIYATSAHRKGGQMFEISADGKQLVPKWTDEVLNTLHGGLLQLDGYVYGSNLKGKWVCIELKTGQVKYETEGVGAGSMIYADGLMYCYGEKGKLALVKASPEGFQIVSSFKIEGGTGPHWAHPVISDGRLYIRHDEVLTVFDIRRK